MADDTWVIPGPGFVCGECGFDFDATDPAATPDTIRAFGRRYRTPLTRGMRDEDLDGVLRRRPDDVTWSALEYACHVRDALGVYHHRIGRVLAEERPEFQPLNRDAVVADARYNEQDPATVADELATAAEQLGDLVASVPDDGWMREGVRQDLVMSVAWMACNAVHEGEHHLLDVGRALRAARGR